MHSTGLGEILIILAILFFCVFLPIVVFVIIRLVIKKGKQVVHTAPDQIQRTVMRGLEKLDAALPNDPREAARWSSGNDEFDINAAATHTAVDREEPDEKLPDQRGTEVSHCSACGAPLKGGSRKCDYCGHVS